MCGIVRCHQQAEGRKLVDVMSERIANRDPDASGTWSHRDDLVSIHLGHRRLSIIDLSAAADQPLRKHGLTPSGRECAMTCKRSSTTCWSEASWQGQG